MRDELPRRLDGRFIRDWLYKRTIEVLAATPPPNCTCETRLPGEFLDEVLTPLVSHDWFATCQPLACALASASRRAVLLSDKNSQERSGRAAAMMLSNFHI